MKQSSTQEFINKSIERFGNFLDYSLVDYKTSTTLVKLICPIHGVFEQKPNTHLNSKTPCSKCSQNIITNEAFIQKAKLLHNNNFEYTLCNYISYKSPIRIICKEHGEFTTLPPYHLESKSGGCQKCSYFKITNTEQFISKSQKIHNYKYDYSLTNYIRNNKKVTIICPIHNEFEQIPSNHYKYGCLKCSGKFLKPQEEFIQECRIAHHNKYDYSLTIYKGMFKQITIICPQHGYYHQLATNHLHGQKGCPKCSKRISKNEILWLNSLNIPNDKSHRNVYINIDSKKYYVDGFDPLTKTIYEYNGDYWHGNLSLYNPNDIHPEAKVSYIELWKKTCAKKVAFENAGYKVISIWESEFIK